MKEFEMPTPCIHCGEWFDLEDGCPSEKWHPDIIMCEPCSQEEEKEMELEAELEDVKIDYENAKWDVENYGKRIKEIEALLNSVQNPETSVATDGASNSEAGNQIPSLPYPTGIIGWVKASERLPEGDGMVLYRDIETKQPNQTSIPVIKYFNPQDFEWLDESPIPLHKEEELERLRSWKRQAIEVMPDMQKIGRLLGIKLGTSVSEQLIPAIEALIKENQELKRKQQ